MLGNPRPGDVYFQEYWEGQAEDMGAVISLSERVKVPYGSFDRVLQTGDYNPLDGSFEHKWYAPRVGLVKETPVGETKSVELVAITRDESQASRTCR
jgi:hypothetical protein